MKQITPELIEKLENLYAELDTITKDASDSILLAREGSEEKKLNITRDEKEIEVTEKDLWDEVYNRATTNAREILLEKYPQAFEKAELAETKRKELNDFILAELDINPDKMRISALLKLITGYIDYKFSVSRETN
jgi:hypothetical protein